MNPVEALETYFSRALLRNFFTRYVHFRERMLLMKACRLLQRWWGKKIQNKLAAQRMRQNIRAAMLLRGYLRKNVARRAKRRREMVDFERAVSVIQHRFRYIRMRAKAAGRLKAKREAAAGKIQKWWRSCALSRTIAKRVFKTTSKLLERRARGELFNTRLTRV